MCISNYSPPNAIPVTKIQDFTDLSLFIRHLYENTHQIIQFIKIMADCFPTPEQANETVLETWINGVP
jgi:hypothetical protein